MEARAAVSTARGFSVRRRSHCATDQSFRQIPVDRVVRRGLIGDRVRPDPAAQELGHDLRGVAEQPDRQRLPVARRPLDERQRLVEPGRADIEIARIEPLLDALRPALDCEHRGARHGRRERLRAAHPAQTRGQDPAAGETAAVMLSAHLDKGFVGALHDALAADVDPRAGRHLAVHHQPLAVELVEVLPGRPVPDQVRVRDEDARCIRMGAEDAHRLARLDQQRLVVAERAQRRDDPVVTVPVARSAADAAVDDQFLGPLGDLGIEVVHQHAQRRFGQPAARRDGRAAWRANRSSTSVVHVFIREARYLQARVTANVPPMMVRPAARATCEDRNRRLSMATLL
jgi:hypothetical protein